MGFDVVIKLLYAYSEVLGVDVNADVLNDDLDVNCQRSTSENPTIKLKICDKVLVKRKFSYFLNFWYCKEIPVLITEILWREDHVQILIHSV